jgi:hypothetical protein
MPVVQGAHGGDERDVATTGATAARVRVGE